VAVALPDPEESSEPFEAGTAAPTPQRTRFAVALQLGRSLPALLALVRAGWLDDDLGVVRESRRIADAILRGARDRSEEEWQKTLLDQQTRTESMRRPRAERR
jgi:hypothetical protein